jgi:hypothetical protein
MRVKELVAFIKEREAIREKKEAGKKRPWTKDEFLGKYRFCNVHREHDRVTKWLRAHWYPMFEKNDDLWFAAVVARLFNLPESLEEIRPFILPFKPDKIRQLLYSRNRRDLKNFNAAYIVSTNGVRMDKVDYILDCVLQPMWDERKHLRPIKNDTLDRYHTALMKFDGMGGFLAAQVIADLKYNDPILRLAEDWDSFASSGPGSRRGLNRIIGWDLKRSWPEKSWRFHLEDLRDKVNLLLVRAGWQPLHAQDLQNCLCEFDKYERVRLGEGMPKQHYKEKI